jgi:hypothetical protein
MNVKSSALKFEKSRSVLPDGRDRGIEGHRHRAERQDNDAQEDRDQTMPCTLHRLTSTGFWWVGRSPDSNELRLSGYHCIHHARVPEVRDGRHLPLTAHPTAAHICNDSRQLMAKRPEKKAAPSKAPELRVLPMQLQIGDRRADERAEWQVIGRPYTTAGGKTVHVCVESVKQPGATDTRTFGAHGRVAVKREGRGR